MYSLTQLMSWEGYALQASELRNEFHADDLNLTQKQQPIVISTSL